MPPTTTDPEQRQRRRLARRTPYIPLPTNGIDGRDMRAKKPPLLSFLLRMETLRHIARVVSLVALDLAGVFLAIFTALAPHDRLDAVSRVLFEESPTIGVRWSERRRSRLAREVVTLPTAYGVIPFKVSRLAGRVVTVTPEFAEVLRIAREKALPVREVLDQARADGRRLLHD